ncbi:radical SAM/SPASM domain-containing protein [Micromonospora matsumotoense]|uniref:radical SAM/SPASM domain-containing protein n=1 Tax=Micromonospora matsumotoense TaxID=121616 RepID=UPI0033E20FC4
MTDIAKYIKQRAQGKGVLNVLSGVSRTYFHGTGTKALSDAAWLKQKSSRTPPQFSMIAIETMSGCNYRCSFCPIGTIKMPSGRMSMELYESLLDQLADFTGVIHPYLFNEPLLDRRLPEMVRMAKERTKASISIQTNGSKLTEELADELTKYATVVVNDYTTDLSVLEKIRQYPARPELVLVDRDPDATLTNRAGNVLGRPTVLLNQFCVRPFNEFYITQDGRVVLCCQDWSVQEVMGNVNDNTIEEIWNNEKYTARRASLLRKERTDLCAKCDFPGI